MPSELARVARDLREWGMEDAFKRIHHFASEQFSTEPSSLDTFVNYCEAHSPRRGQENEQTIERARAVLRELENGASRDGALAAAWHEYPLVTR